jgi:hypothetical protein
MHQLHLIIDTLGTPSTEDTEYTAAHAHHKHARDTRCREQRMLMRTHPRYIASEKAKVYIQSLPFKSKVSWRGGRLK